MLKHRHVQILKSIERVLNQNRYDELIYSRINYFSDFIDNQNWFFHIDFKYFEDKTDDVRDPMGTLFPLWKFPPSVSNRSVTALTWNPTYSDMLIIGYGLCKIFCIRRSICSIERIFKIIKRNEYKVLLLSLH